MLNKDIYEKTNDQEYIDQFFDFKRLKSQWKFDDPNLKFTTNEITDVKNMD